MCIAFEEQVSIKFCICQSVIKDLQELTLKIKIRLLIDLFQNHHENKSQERFELNYSNTFVYFYGVFWLRSDK